jgi:hypothetical protein
MSKPDLYALTFLLVMSFASMVTSSEVRKTYSNNDYRFTFDYPSSCDVKGLSKWYFDLLREGKMLLRSSVEDDTFKIFVGASKPQRDAFIRFSRERARVVCGADGPDGSSYCEKIKSERAYTTRNGLCVLEFYLTLTREDYVRKTKKTSTAGPVYMVDISRTNKPLALMLFPGYGNVASESTEQLAREIIETLRLL